MEALLQALYHEKDSGHFFRTYLKKSNNRVNGHISITRETTVEKREGGGVERAKENGREGGRDSQTETKSVKERGREGERKGETDRQRQG